jgi:hypothetical protein
MAPSHETDYAWHLIMIDNEVLYESDHEWHLIMIDSPIYGRLNLIRLKPP